MVLKPRRLGLASSRQDPVPPLTPQVGPGGAMLAALGGVSSAYHLQASCAAAAACRPVVCCLLHTITACPWWGWQHCCWQPWHSKHGCCLLKALPGPPAPAHPTHPMPTLQKFLAWRSYEQSRILQAERMLREYAHKHPSDQAAAATLEATHSELGARQGRHMQAPSAAAAGAAHGRPHLDRRTPVPPGGF